MLVAALLGACGEAPNTTTPETTTAPAELPEPKRNTSPPATITDAEVADYAEQLQTDNTTARAIVTKELELKQKLDQLTSRGGNESEVKKHLTNLFANLSAIAPEVPVDGTQDGGSSLPDAFLEVFPNGSTGGTYENQLLSADLPWITDDTLYELRSLLAAPQVLAQRRPDVLLDFVTQQLNHLPPTQADFVLYYSTITAIREHQPKTETANKNRWLELRSAKNPIYRLLALKSARWVSEDEQTLLDFYRSYLGEQDSALHLAARDEINALNTVAAAELLGEFEKKLD